MSIGRRSVLGLGGAAIAAACLAPSAWASEGPIRIGLVGADSEGIILAKDAMRADRRVRLVAIADESMVAARRALMVFAHPLRRQGVHPQLDMNGNALFWGANAARGMLNAVPLDVVLLVGPARSVARGVATAVAMGVDAYVKPVGACDAVFSGAMIEAASVARGVTVGVDAPWLFESEAVPKACRLSYARTEDARSRSFAAFLSARAMGFYERGFGRRLELMAGALT